MYILCTRACVYIWIGLQLINTMCTSQERARPEFEQKIKRYIRHCKDDKAREKFFVYNPVLEKREYVQPTHWFFPKVIATFSILISMVRTI